MECVKNICCSVSNYLPTFSPKTQKIVGITLLVAGAGASCVATGTMLYVAGAVAAVGLSLLATAFCRNPVSASDLSTGSGLSTHSEPVVNPTSDLSTGSGLSTHSEPVVNPTSDLSTGSGLSTHSEPVVNPANEADEVNAANALREQQVVRQIVKDQALDWLRKAMSTHQGPHSSLNHAN